LSCAALLAAPASQAQTPTAQLAQPPASAAQWVITSAASVHGHSWRWTTPDSVRHSRESILLRGFVTEIDQTLSVDANGNGASLAVRGSTPSGDAAESYSAANGRFEYKSPVDGGSGALASGASYSSYGGTLDSFIVIADALKRAPDHTLALEPA